MAASRKFAFSHTHQTTAPPAAVWRVWTDVDRWPAWDQGLAGAETDGPLQLQQTGTIIAHNVRRSPFVISTFTPGRAYTIDTRLIGSTLYVHRYLEPMDTGTRFTHGVWFSGWTAGIFGRWLGPQFKTLLPQSMARIDQLATQIASA